jgi:GAF domain-containing protein
LSSADLVEEEPRAKPPSIPPPLPPRRSVAPVARISERDALSAARACLEELAQLVPCRVALIHWLDVVRRDFVVAHARGDGAESMVLERSSYDDPLLRIAMQKNEPFAWGDLRKAPVSRLARFSGLGGVRTVLVCPIVSGPRQLGAVELVDPFDVRFRTNDIVNARRVTEGYASFLAANGLVVDIANIARFAARSMER